MTKMEALKEVNANLTAVLNKLEVYIFTENINGHLEESVDKQKTVEVKELKQ